MSSTVKKTSNIITGICTQSGSSLKANDERRANTYFESKEEARARVKAAESRGKPKKCIKIPDNWNKDGLLNYVKNMPDNSNLNMTKIGNMFGVPNKHHQANKIVKQFLIDNDVDLTRFDNKWVKASSLISKNALCNRCD